MGDYFSVGDIQVIPLFDPPHLLKGMRNGLLTKDLKFCLQGENKTASWQHILQFYAIDHREYRAVPSLTDLCAVPEKIKKMKVSYCCQVFSQRLSSVMGLLASVVMVWIPKLWKPWIC
ncbi:uncharacterized protein LOC124170861 [Ischnura elegans]|uniref:uncharacterized protein LOC124170861 n=1 Tax=Ischnura elegans TaxID=197161 RepID=UPI001ED878D3|nr:uncharacterized protein LOC124170861 [Ischnura elegans]